jgi:Membrane proteins related to metalloendopeptidases
MDEKNNKTTNFFKREGFYVLLFVCICIVATVAAITAKNKANNNNPIVDSNANTNIGDAAETHQDPDLNYDNALQVEEKTNKNKNNSTANKTTVPVAATKTEWGKPVVGKLARPFSNGVLVKWESTNSLRANNGVDIQAANESKVYAVLDGVVLDVFTDNDGIKVIIDHQNGYKSIYANLAENVSVKKGTKISKGQVIGYVGKTTLNSAYEKYGDHLHFEVMKGSSYVDPAKFISKYL